eukprot:6207366-Pleurochrysis_carterae.AAC.2
MAQASTQQSRVQIDEAENKGHRAMYPRLVSRAKKDSDFSLIHPLLRWIYVMVELVKARLARCRLGNSSA